MRSGSTDNARSIPASTPAQTRVYAVGDIHGRADLLAEITARIDDDRRRRPIPHAVEVYLGDYIDRGPDSRSVIDQLAVRLVRNAAVCLRGNHETFLAEFLRDPATIHHWIELGALPTLASYGVPLRAGDTALDLQQALIRAFPRTHDLFLQCLHDSFRCGDFLFVHAGIRPGIPLPQQDPQDLCWIRDEFLDSTADHGVMVVHGHTPVLHPQIHANRINIDTGAWLSGVLTCIAIEGRNVMIL